MIGSWPAKLTRPPESAIDKPTSASKSSSAAVALNSGTNVVSVMTARMGAGGRTATKMTESCRDGPPNAGNRTSTVRPNVGRVPTPPLAALRGWALVHSADGFGAVRTGRDRRELRGAVALERRVELL